MMVHLIQGLYGVDASGRKYCNNARKIVRRITVARSERACSTCLTQYTRIEADSHCRWHFLPGEPPQTSA